MLNDLEGKSQSELIKIIKKQLNHDQVCEKAYMKWQLKYQTLKDTMMVSQCYECGRAARELSDRSRCVRCEHRRALVNEKENEQLRERIAKGVQEVGQQVRRGQKNYTIAEMQMLYNMFKDGATFDEMYAKFPDRTRENFKGKLSRMGLTKTREH